MDKGQFLLYQTPDGDELFQRNKSTISRHVKNVLEDGELEEKSVVAFFATTTKHKYSSIIAS